MPKYEFSEILEKYLDINRMYHFEMESGVRNITRIAEAIGYRQGIAEMLADNPGMQQAIVDWLMEQNVQDWAEMLVKEIGDDTLPDVNGCYCDEEDDCEEDSELPDQD